MSVFPEGTSVWEALTAVVFSLQFSFCLACFGGCALMLGNTRSEDGCVFVQDFSLISCHHTEGQSELPAGQSGQ